jgi:hypothetical protein
MHVQRVPPTQPSQGSITGLGASADGQGKWEERFCRVHSHSDSYERERKRERERERERMERKREETKPMLNYSLHLFSLVF